MFATATLATHPLLLFILTLTINIKYEDNSPTTLEQYFEDDLKYCFNCFQHQIADCRALYPNLKYDKEKQILNLLSYMLPKTTKRRQYWLELQSDDVKPVKIVAKEFAHNYEHDGRRLEANLSVIRNEFLRPERLDGLQFCPQTSLDKFVQHFMQPKDEQTVWLYMLFNIQPMLLPHLEQQGFKVPKTFGVCGLTLFQANAGLPLSDFNAADFKVKLKIAQQLLSSSIEFSYGFSGYRIYLTDITADNIVYDAEREQLSFVDLDSIYIVDSSVNANTKSSIHRHDYIECDDCFAYSPDALCSHHLSDINLYEACQFLSTDLKGNPEGGFLHPIPKAIAENHPKLLNLLEDCVKCAPPKCMQRFTVAAELIVLMEGLIL